MNGTRSRRPAAAWLAAWFLAEAVVPAFAQNRVVAPIEGFSAPASPAVAVPGTGMGGSATGVSRLLSGPGLNAAPSAPAVLLSPHVLSAAAAGPAAGEASGIRAAAAPALSPAAGLAAASAPEPLKAETFVRAERPAVFMTGPAASSSRASAAPRKDDGISTDPRSAAAIAEIEAGAASWEPRESQSLDGSSVRAAASEGMRPLISAEWPDEPAAKPAPEAPAPDASRARPRLARAVFYSGAVLVAAAAFSFAIPALIPAAFAAAKGPALYVGFSLLSASRFWRAPTAASPRGPPSTTGFAGWARRIWARIDALDKRYADWSGRHAPIPWRTRLLRTPAGLVMWLPITLVAMARSLLATWGTAKVAADSQTVLEGRAGGSSWDAMRDWFVGGLRAAAVWVPLALGGMLAGWAIAKPFAHLVSTEDMVGMLSFETIQKYGLLGHVFGFVASSFAAQAVSLGVFDAIRGLSAKFGAGRASAWIGGAAALAVSAGLILMVTTTPSVIGSMLGIEAAVLWLRTRSQSWLAPMALRGIFSLLTLEAARLGLGLAMGGAAGAALAGLPAYAGLAVTGMLLAGLVWAARGLRPAALWAALKAQFARVGEFGRSWRAPRHDGAPHSPWPLFKLAALWGTILYAAGDLVFGGIHLAVGGNEPTPAALVQMLTSPTDLVLYNFLLVGFLEEFVFRRGLFKAIYGRLKKWGMTGGRLFWVGAVASGLIFSGAHYIDFGALLAHLGMGDATAASGLGGMYAFTLAGFTARAALGVVLAWLYAESGTLLLPILAHFFADSLEGLGLHWGFVPFLAIVAGGLLIQRVGSKRKARPA